MAEIFISYAETDKLMAKGLQKEISRIGWSVWWDEQFHGGERTLDDIVERIIEARLVLVLWTQTSCNSSWVISESAIARSKGKTVLPLVLGERLKPPDIFLPTAPIKVSAGPEESELDKGSVSKIINRLEEILGSYRKLHKTDCLRIMSWNLAGAKHLAKGPDEATKVRRELTEQLSLIVNEHKPHVVLLQEYVKFAKFSDDKNKAVGIIDSDKIFNYKIEETEIINNAPPSHPEKWQHFSDWGSSFLSQGMAMLWNTDLCVGNFWDFKTSEAQGISKEIGIPTELVRIETGFYTGNRDTEPRAVVANHFIFGPNDKPLDLFVVNVHLATLKNEREGKPLFDERGTRVRMSEIDVLLHGLVSRYNSWWDAQSSKGPRQEPIWILAGDFNCTPNSPEIRRIIQSQFLNLNPKPKWGSRGGDRELNVDYIFAGPKYRSLRHRKVEKDARKNPPSIRSVVDRDGKTIQLKTSDHFPVFAKMQLKY